MGRKSKRMETETDEVDEAESCPMNTQRLEKLVNGDSRVSKKQCKKRKKREKDREEVVKEIPTVSIAVPGSIIDNAQSLELATRLAGQVARAATIFRIHEVVVFDNKTGPSEDVDIENMDNSDENESGAAFLIRILRYLETPQYLRKPLFPMHKNLRFVGILPPLDAPHHLRKHEWGPYREGITVKIRDSNSTGTLVDVGLCKHVIVDQLLEPNKRITVAMGVNRNLDDDLPRQVVPSSKPREDGGLYWGYNVRYSHNLGSVFKDCKYKGGYDYVIGTSEHGQKIRSSNLVIPSFRHLLIAFGGLAGLEESVKEDNDLKERSVREVFDIYLNTCPNQGSRTIRTEEAIFTSLQYFQEPICRALEG